VSEHAAVSARRHHVLATLVSADGLWSVGNDLHRSCPMFRSCNFVGVQVLINHFVD
jgi:hypothetical protein